MDTLTPVKYNMTLDPKILFIRRRYSPIGVNIGSF